MKKPKKAFKKKRKLPSVEMVSLCKRLLQQQVFIENLSPNGLGKRLKLSDAESALSRISNGRFGKCTTCDHPLSLKQLYLDPSTSNCRHCERKKERRRKQMIRLLGAKDGEFEITFHLKKKSTADKRVDIKNTRRKG